MQQYGVRDVERLLRLPRSTIRALMDAGFVSPTRGPRNAWLFSFRDLIVLRTAQALAAADVPRQRITRSVKELRRRLPDSMPLSGLSICAVGGRVVVKEGTRRWNADSGQYLLAFEGDPEAGSLSVMERIGVAKSQSAADWFEAGLELESKDPVAAAAAYERAIAAQPSRLDARVNLGRLLHESRQLHRAEQVYREAVARCGGDAVLFYNLGVLLDDMARKSEAMEAYRAALRSDPRFSDCHYNLALLCQELGKPRDAIRHMAQYRKLTAN
ncbi:MAG: tetratricopeptide repeat protein [Betaproteobacteria bacterium]